VVLGGKSLLKFEVLVSVRSGMGTLHPKRMNPEPSTLPPACRAGAGYFFRDFDLNWRSRNPAACGTHQGNVEKKWTPSEGWWCGQGRSPSSSLLLSSPELSDTKVYDL